MMVIMVGFYVLLVFTAAYCLLMLHFAWGLYSLRSAGKAAEAGKSMGFSEKPVRVSVIIPVRNEVHTIDSLLEQMVAQDYPPEAVEFLVSDDFSEDATCERVMQWVQRSSEKGIRLVRPCDAREEMPGKKAAIARAVAEATGDLLLFTDADTHRGPHWITTMAGAWKESKGEMVLGPVMFSGEKNLLQKIQTLEFLGIMGVTAGAVASGKPVMCNGANLACTRRAFVATGGYYGNEQFRSGDDQFLMLKVKNKYSARAIHFCYDPYALVSTEPVRTLAAFAHQRLRWISKGKGYRDPFTLFTALETYLTQLLLLTFWIAGLWVHGLLPWCGALWLIKILVDYLLVARMAGFCKKTGLEHHYFLAQLFQLFYVPLSGLLVWLLPFKWKGRTGRQ